MGIRGCECEDDMSEAGDNVLVELVSETMPTYSMIDFIE